MEEFQKLYMENYRAVFFYLWHMSKNKELAEDLAQDTFYHILSLICSGKQLTVNKKWFITVAHNVFLDYLRKNRAVLESLETCTDCPKTCSGPPESAKRLDMLSALDQLPARYKSLILLKEHYGFSCAEIAEITGSTEASVKVSLFRARNRFKEVYKQNE